MSALTQILRDALAQRAGSDGARGLMRPGKAPLMDRLAFLLSTGRDERNYAIGQYLDTRRTGGRFANGRRRTGEYSGVYAGADGVPAVRETPQPETPWQDGLFGELSPREAQLARAEAMDFDTSRVFYRGSRSDERIARPNEGTHGKRYYINRTPERGSEHAGIYEPDAIGGNVMPLFVRRGKFQPTVGAEGGVADGRDVRSIFAQFDPAQANSSDLLAGLAVGVPVGALTLREALRGRMMGEA